MTPRDPRGDAGAGRVPDAENLRLAGVVHDINQMLSVVTGRAGLLRADEHDAGRCAHLDAILLAAADAAVMLQRVLAPQPTNVGTGADLAAAAEEARLLAWPQERRGWTWQSRLAAGLVTSVPDQVLREVLVNLLLNAREALGDGGALLLEADRERTGDLLLHVSDNGPGLPGGDPEAIFAVGRSASGKAGRGVGLPACRELLRSHGGDLTAAPASGGGARFTLRLPGGTLPTSRAAAARTGTADPGLLVGLPVLVVDDEEVVREMLRDVLAACGCEVRTCRDADEARAAWAEQRPRVALIDRHLPGTGGLELATALRDDDHCVAIALMSGWQEAGGETVASVHGADFVVRKPLSLEQIQNILTEGARLCARRCRQADPN